MSTRLRNCVFGLVVLAPAIVALADTTSAVRRVPCFDADVEWITTGPIERVCVKLAPDPEPLPPLLVEGWWDYYEFPVDCKLSWAMRHAYVSDPLEAWSDHNQLTVPTPRYGLLRWSYERSLCLKVPLGMREPSEPEPELDDLWEEEEPFYESQWVLKVPPEYRESEPLSWTQPLYEPSTVLRVPPELWEPTPQERFYQPGWTLRVPAELRPEENRPLPSEPFYQPAYCLKAPHDVLEPQPLPEMECPELVEGEWYWPIGINMSLYAAHIENRGVGYETGYSSVGLFFTPMLFSHPMVRPVFDGRFHVLDDGKIASNLIAGSRFITWAENVYGVEAAYDWRLARKGYHQLGLSLERLSCDYDLRLNGYFPIGHHAFMSSVNVFKESFSEARQFIRERQKAGAGFDGEIGSCLMNSSGYQGLSLYGAIGPYYYTNDVDKCCCSHHTIAGGKARLALRYLNYADLEVRSSYDPVFHVVVQGLLVIRFPFGNQKSATCGPVCDVDATAAQPIVRNDLVVLDKPRCLWSANF